MDQALSHATYRDQFDLRQHWAVRVGDLQELLRHQPHIVHFSGHGSPGGQLIRVCSKLVDSPVIASRCGEAISAWAAWDCFAAAARNDVVNPF